jgi:CheY-like chemotaxis protein
LVDDVQHVAKLCTEATPIRHERVDVALLLQLTAEDRRSSLVRAGVELDLQIPETPLAVVGDRTRLVQLFDNLLCRAAISSSPGNRVKVSAGADAAAAEVMIAVCFADVDAARANEGKRSDRDLTPGFSSVRPRDPQEIGLAVLRGIAASHGGSVTEAHHSARWESEITVRLPAADNPNSLRAAKAETADAVLRRRVLVVEDNRDAATSLSVLLELMGHEVRVAYSGPEALEVASQWPPEITISDIGLPGFDGFEVARRLRGQLGSGPLLVALTGYGRDEDRRQSHEAGFDHHLVKPADPVVLQRVLAGAR